VRKDPTLTPTPTSTPLPGIFGYIRERGASAAGVTVELRFFDGVQYSTADSAVTNAAGLYQFRNAPSLTTNQHYYVRYSNVTYPTRLYFWSTRILAGYTTDASANIGNFDIGNVALASPNNDARVALPSAFEWQRRVAATTDNYSLYISEVASPSTVLFTSDRLSYPIFSDIVDFSLSRTAFESNNLTYEKTYEWRVLITGSDGAQGLSFEARKVRIALP
jgi:hypothetical protein